MFAHSYLFLSNWGTNVIVGIKCKNLFINIIFRLLLDLEYEHLDILQILNCNMLEWFDYLFLIAAGAIGGFMSGLIGVGGGIIFVPILTYFLSRLGYADEVLVKAVLANSLFAIIFTGGTISFKQYRLGNFYPKEVLATAIPGIASSLLMSSLIEMGTWYSKGLFNLVFGALLLPLIFKTFFGKKLVERDSKDEIPRKFYQIIGALTGIVSSLSGLGGGVVMIPAFTDGLKLNIKKASSISTGVIPLFALPISIYYMFQQPTTLLSPFQLGYVCFPVISPIILASFLFSPLGVKMAHASKPQTIRLVYGLFICILFVKILIDSFFK
jgi:uncharacterized membrane protein YfcA